MQQPISGPITFAATGDIVVPLPFKPSRIEFHSGGKAGTNEVTSARSSVGHADPVYQWAAASLSNTAGDFSRTYLGTHCFAVLDGPSGNPVVLGKVKTWSANLVLTLTKANSAWPIFMTVFP